MEFKTDEQTMLDLSIISSTAPSSVVNLFKPVTIGGQLMLMQFFNRPQADADLLTKRLEIINYIQTNKLLLLFNKEELDFIEYYLNQANPPKYASNVRAVKNAIKQIIGPTSHYYIIKRGVSLLIKLLNHIGVALNNVNLKRKPYLLNDFLQQINTVLHNSDYHKVRLLKDKADLSPAEVEWCDFLFRGKGHAVIKSLLDVVYQLDVYESAASTAAKYGFAYPVIVNNDECTLSFEGLFHPLLTQPVANDIDFSTNANLCFMTGANMAGKSTLLKSVGIAVLLAHIGFPVPASAMKTSLFNGLYTTINLSDNINAGHSHFYAEVLRIKEIAQNIQELKKVVVVFDELFRGTNVKDAYDASLQIIKALANIKSCVFIVSTHIIEVGEQLKGTENIFFKCLKTTLNGTEAVYDYKLQDGITDERLGLKIIEDEGIFTLLHHIQSTCNT
jgi:DNA mismatch repair protein MutS